MTWNTVFLGLGFGLLGIAVVLAVREHRWLRQAHIAQGTVIELIVSRGSKGSPSYTPRVRFQARNGTLHEFTRGYSSSPPEFSQGEQVPVAYDPQTFQGRILTFGQRYWIATLLGTLGLAMICFAGSFLVGRQLMPKLYPITPSSAGPGLPRPGDW